ncbi:hypothetical protein V1477_006732 [Vespula maculifrons]|uniref:Uncharacterized protein n=1 Tax=Vespula maculifrons TaxID=7453 RepID=A0ABD2CHA0_VESMC
MRSLPWVVNLEKPKHSVNYSELTCFSLVELTKKIAQSDSGLEKFEPLNGEKEREDGELHRSYTLKTFWFLARFIASSREYSIIKFDVAVILIGAHPSINLLSLSFV